MEVLHFPENSENIIKILNELSLINERINLLEEEYFSLIPALGKTFLKKGMYSEKIF